MLLEDVSLGIMPIGGRSSRSRFSISTSPADKRAEKIIAGGLAARDRYFRDSLAESLFEFFRLLAAELCVEDRATHEIVYFEEPETHAFTGFDLLFIPDSQLVTKWGRTYQVVPPEVAQESKVAKLIPLPKEDLLVFTPPATYETALRNLRASLVDLDGMRFPSLALEAMQKGMPYDFKAHERSMKLALMEAIRPIGWTARGSFSDFIMSYYLVHLAIAFERFKIHMRDTILETLNSGLKRIGDKLGFKTQIQISGLPTLSDVDTARHNLNSGVMPWTDVMKPFKLQ